MTSFSQKYPLAEREKTTVDGEPTVHPIFRGGRSQSVDIRRLVVVGNSCLFEIGSRL